MSKLFFSIFAAVELVRAATILPIFAVVERGGAAAGAGDAAGGGAEQAAEHLLRGSGTNQPGKVPR